MRKILNAAYLLFMLFLAYHIICGLCSCATVRKDASSFETEDKYIDTSRETHDQEKETTIDEKGTVPVTTDADSVATSGSMSAEDTTAHEQTVETDDMSLTTTVKPKTNNKGKITGYDINSKAISKPKTINAPIDRKTTIKEKSTDKQQTAITKMKKQAATSSSKSIFRFNMAGVCAIVGSVVVVLLFIYLGGRFKKKKDEK